MSRHCRQTGHCCRWSCTSDGWTSGSSAASRLETTSLHVMLGPSQVWPEYPQELLPGLEHPPANRHLGDAKDLGNLRIAQLFLGPQQEGGPELDRQAVAGLLQQGLGLLGEGGFLRPRIPARQRG